MTMCETTQTILTIKHRQLVLFLNN